VRVALVNQTSGGLSGGYRKYLNEMLPRLTSHDEVSALRCFVPEGSAVTPASPTSAFDPRRASQLHGLIDEFRPDVVFVPTARVLSYRAPVVTMVRNMEPFSVPLDGNPPAESARNMLRLAAAVRAARRADRVIAVSHHVAARLRAVARIDEHKLDVIPHGVSLDAPSGESAEGDDRPFLLAAGSVRPARGLEELLRGFALVERSDLRLLIAGGVDPRMESYASAMRRLAETLGVSARVEWLGSTPPDVLALLMSQCMIFVTTSHAEACPNTLLEAMAYGCVCVSTDLEPMPEFLADAGSYFRARDPRSLAATLQERLSSPTNDSLRTRARERAGTFTWDRTVDLTVGSLIQAIRN
jgi:glycosyltransferase involved in cell wall biosynthesis